MPLLSDEVHNFVFSLTRLRAVRENDLQAKQSQWPMAVSVDFVRKRARRWRACA